VSVRAFSYFWALVLALTAGKTAAQTVYLQANAHHRVCKATITDSDANTIIKGYYGHNENSTLVLSVPGAASITLNFSSFCTEKDEDVLRIFDGKDTNSTLIGAYSGNTSPGVVTSSDSFITLHFRSDKSIACTGWEAAVSTKIIAPKAVKMSLVKALSCQDSVFEFKLDKPIPCDSMNAANTVVSGTKSMSLSKVIALDCKNGRATQFKLISSAPFDINGSYTVTHTHGYRDFCDSIYRLSSTQTFSVTNCPIKVVLSITSDTLCQGECAKLSVSAMGGQASKYQYTWLSGGLSGAGPHTVCPKANARYIVRVSDGSAIPGYDTLDVVVLAPPKAQSDTTVCYYGSNFTLQASPAGGTWYGRGIVNGATGEFKPYGNYGVRPVWYQVGGCADTVVVTVLTISNLENFFCPSKNQQTLYWYSPAGGVWSGPKVTPDGKFMADTMGVYTLSYEWKGCKADKKVIVDQIQVPEFDTTCESRSRDTLTFAPKGLYPSWFQGLLSYYYGWYDPSSMKGPGNYNIIYIGRGGCRDTTKLTVLPCKAGKNDTFCPSAGIQKLSAFRPTNQYEWQGKGILSGNSDDYDPSWTKGADAKEWLVLKTPQCSDGKWVHIIATRILGPDTLWVCPEDGIRPLAAMGWSTSVGGGQWSGAGISQDSFSAQAAGVGTHQIRYTAKGCYDEAILVVRPKPAVMNDTALCQNALALPLWSADSNGTYTGAGVYANPWRFNAATALAQKGKQQGVFVVNYRSSKGCANEIQIQVDTLPSLNFKFNSPYCLKDSGFQLGCSPLAPAWSWTGPGAETVNGGLGFRPRKAGTGTHTLQLDMQMGACRVLDSIEIRVLDTLKAVVVPVLDSVCYGETRLLRASSIGGVQPHQVNWSHNQSGLATYVTPTQTTVYTATASDGCSDPALTQVPVVVHPRLWFQASSSDPQCYGLKGFVTLSLRSGNPVSLRWDYTQSLSDTLWAPVGGKYRVNAVDLKTLCYGDTTVEIPGFAAIQAGFFMQLGSGQFCLSPLLNQVQFFNNSVGATTGTWFWGDGTSKAFAAGSNEIHAYLGDSTRYKVLLAVANDGGCTDTAEAYLCYKDTVILYVPTAFSPNEDGHNDQLEFHVYGSTEVDIQIYNRWGQRVFESQNASEKWDGTYSGKPCPEGVYAVYIKYRGRRQAPRAYAGSVTLLRPNE